MTVSEDNETYEAGKAFIRLGLKLKNGVDTGLDSETLKAFLALSKSIPNAAEKKGPPKWTKEKDPFGGLILSWLKSGEPIPTGQNKDIRNALTRLRRNGLIENIGTRHEPIWRMTSDETKAKVISDLKSRREKHAKLKETKEKHE